MSNHKRTPATDPISDLRDRFLSAFRKHPAGVAVVTADAGQGPVAFTATSVASVSADPPVLIFSIAAASSSSTTVCASSSLVVHLIEDDEIELAKLCATSGVDRFADPRSWDRLESGEPYYVHARTRLLGEVIDRMDLGNSTVLAVRVVDITGTEMNDARTPLVYHDRTWHSLTKDSDIDRKQPTN